MCSPIQVPALALISFHTPGGNSLIPFTRNQEDIMAKLGFKLWFSNLCLFSRSLLSNMNSCQILGWIWECQDE